MNKKIILFVLALILLVSLIGCDLLFGSYDHQCSYSEWEVTKPATCRLNGIEERYCYICYDTESRVLEKAAHKPVDYKGKAASCTEEGSTSGVYCDECNAIISGIKDIPPTGHTEVIDPAIEPVDGKPGRTEGSHCSSCGVVFVKQQSIFSTAFSDADRYSGNYGYSSLSDLENGYEMQTFYNELDAVISDFHDSLNDATAKENGENTVYSLAEVTYSDNGISSEEAFATLSAYMKDHPLYYWISKQITYTEDYLTVLVDYEYVDGEVREQINAGIYKKVEEYVGYLNGEISIYGITLGLHDLIIEGANYAYLADGVTPSREVFANNVTGVLLEGKGVCESYAKAFQLILNYCGIENVYVTGYAGEPHGWNLVKLDDGRWYWYDLTWDDQPDWMLGVRHNYFCVSSSDTVDWKDSGTGGTKSFLQDHTPDIPGNVGINYAYKLPAVSNTPYNQDGPMLRDEALKIDGLSYVMIGFNKLALVDIDKTGDVVIPETVDFDGTNMQVVCIAKYDEKNGILISGSVIYYDQATRRHIDVTSITIPGTVEFIWNYTFDHCNTIKSFSVSEDNPAFASHNGVLFTKSLYTLIKYPLAKTATSYTVPQKTVEIAYGAFGDGGNLFCPKYLKLLTVPDTVEIIGAVNGGRGYRDSTPKDSKDIIFIDGYIDRLRAMLGVGLIIN